MNLSNIENIKKYFKQKKQPYKNAVLKLIPFALILDGFSWFAHDSFLENYHLKISQIHNIHSLILTLAFPFTTSIGLILSINIWCFIIKLFMNNISPNDLILSQDKNISMYEEKSITEIINILLSVYFFMVKNNELTNDLNLDKIKTINAAFFYNKNLLDKFDISELPEDKQQIIKNNQKMIDDSVVFSLSYINKYFLLENKKFKKILENMSFKEKISEIQSTLKAYNNIDQLEMEKQEENAKKESLSLEKLLTTSIKSLSL